MSSRFDSSQHPRDARTKRFVEKDSRHGDADLMHPPVQPDSTPTPMRGPVSHAEYAQDVKYRIEALAAKGDARGATRLARKAGAFVKGDRLPYGDGLAAYWDGRELVSLSIDGSRVEVLDWFDENSLPARR